uniref:Uncharacterized protein n=1 Tax=Romanomermis culicivorax TaxID=13658 RepID=A0A915LBF4_ROMCU
METSTIVETDSSFGQPQDRQDNASFLLSRKNFIVDLKFWEKEYFQKILGTIFRQDDIIVGFHIKEDIRLVLTKFGYLDQEKELAQKRCDNIDYILSCCVYNLEIVLDEMKDKAETQLVGQAMDHDKPELTNILPTPPVYAKAGGQCVENITNPEKFARVMQYKRLMKEKRIVQEENKAELEKVKAGNFQQPASNLNDKIKYQRGLGKWGQALNKALKRGKYVVDYQYGRISLSKPCVQKYLAHMVPTLNEEVALMAMELTNSIYDEAGLEIETIRYYELQFHVLQANLLEKLWYIFEAQLTEWTMM